MFLPLFQFYWKDFKQVLKTEHQLCIVHQIRNSLKYVSYKHRKSLVGGWPLITGPFLI
ncbi:hypothetical protein [Spiroplasma endosymbiont of Acasis viretata]|uniref:hypothetical protein n=1 Tax=Spiroplasma endosymbiont of Acasis viretata TaxID=3066306 RepID=UPI00313B58B8